MSKPTLSRGFRALYSPARKAEEDSMLRSSLGAIVALAFVQGCASAPVQPPTLQVAGLKVGDVGLTGVSLEVKFRVRNPNQKAVKIDRFIRDVEASMKAATKGPSIAQGDLSSDYKFELKRLLFLTPAITEAVAFDRNGVMQAQISRFRGVAADASGDLSASTAFQQARQGISYFGPVYFVRQSEPYMTIAMAGAGEDAGYVIGCHSERSEESQICFLRFYH
jgi:hypothetical protein